MVQTEATTVERISLKEVRLRDYRRVHTIPENALKRLIKVETLSRNAEALLPSPQAEGSDRYLRMDARGSQSSCKEHTQALSTNRVVAAA
jgi:hypothetical protein